MYAYIASENGQATLKGCGGSALVPVATAIQRLAENDINITVIVPQTLFNRQFNQSDTTFLVNEQGQVVYFIDGENSLIFIWDNDRQRYSVVPREEHQEAVEAWGSLSLGTWTYGQDKTVTVNGVRYTFTAQGNYYTLTPAAGTYNG